MRTILLTLNCIRKKLHITKKIKEEGEMFHLVLKKCYHINDDSSNATVYNWLSIYEELPFGQ